MNQPYGRFFFGRFCLDSHTGVLTKDEMPVSLGPTAYELLLYLVQHAERLISYEELEQALWPDSAAEVDLRNALHKHIGEIRHALEDNIGRPHCVRNVRGKGYRFLPPVRRTDVFAAHARLTPQTHDAADHAGIRDVLASIGVSAPERIIHLLRETIRLIAVKGTAAPEVKEKLTDAMALCDPVDPPRFFVTLQALCLHFVMQGQLRAAHEVGGTLPELAKSLPSSYGKYAHGLLGVILCLLGKYQEAWDFLERGPVPDDHDAVMPMVSFTDLCVSRWCYMAHASYALGYPEQACRLMDQALELANNIFDIRNVIFCCQLGAGLYQLMRQPDMVQQWAARVIEFSANRYHPWPAGGRILQGWASAKQGDVDRGIGMIEQGIKDWEASRARATLPRSYTLLAEAYGEAGRVETGLQALHTALEIMEDTGDRHYAAETYRMRGVLLLRQGTPSATDEAEVAFGKALRIAREQQAPSFALRVAISWGGHLVETNRPDDARRLLGRIYDGFTEGSGTLDHQEAQALLQRVR